MHDHLFALMESHLPKAMAALSDHRPYAKESDPVKDGATVVLGLSGILTPRGSFFGDSTSRFSENILRAAGDDRIGAIVLNIDSPGGLVYGTEEAAEAVFQARQRKPVIAIANSQAASAAYWIGSQATAFYAAPGADVGSIGVYSMHADYSQALEAEGVKVTFFSAGRRKVEANPYQPLTEEAVENRMADIQASYQDFVSAVARGRSVSADKVRSAEWGEGATVSAKPAAEAGLIDGVMTLRDVLAKYSASRSRKGLMRRKAQLAERLSA